MKSSRSNLLCLLSTSWLGLVAIGGAAHAAEPLRFEVGAVTVEMDQRPFRMRVLDPNGEPLLKGIGFFDGPVDPFDQFGPLGYSWNIDVTVGKPPYYGYDWYQGVPTQWQHATRVLEWSAEPGRMTLTLESEDLRRVKILLVLERVSDRSFRLHAEPSDPSVANRMGQSFDIPGDEKFFGFGERFYHAEHRGRLLHNWVEDGGFGLGKLEPLNDKDPFPYGPMMTNWPIPFLLSSKGYGLWLDTTHRSTFDLGHTDAETLRFDVETNRLDYVFFYGPEPLRVIEQFTGETGRAPLLDEWAFAPRIRSNLGDDLPEQLRAAKAGVTGLDTALHLLPQGSHRGREEELRRELPRLGKMGFKVLSYFNNFVSARYHPVYDEGAAAGYFVKNPAGEPYLVWYPGYPEVALVDFTNPAAVAWYQRLLDESADYGFHGYMYDFAEYVPRDAVFFDGRRGDAVHNEYPMLYHRAAFEAMERKFGRDFLVFARSGYTGSQRYVTTWPGDLDTTWSLHNGLPSALFAGLNIGISGVPFYGSEIGGYHMVLNAPTDKELYLRWVELGAYSPLMGEENDGWSIDGAAAPFRWHWWSDEETLQHWVKFTREHTALLPYIYAYAKEASETGAPIQRHLFLDFPDDPGVYGIDTEFMLGREMLVAPVLEQGATSRQVYLPAGEWIDQDSGERTVGPKVVVASAPLGKVPVYLRSGSIVPRLSADVETLAPSDSPSVVDATDRAGILEARIYLDAERTARFTLADGTELEAGPGTLAQFPPMAVRSRVHGALGRSQGDGVGWRMDGRWLRVRIQATDDEITIDGPARTGSLTIGIHGTQSRLYRLDIEVPSPGLPGSPELPVGEGLVFAGAVVSMGVYLARRRLGRGGVGAA